MMAIMKIETVEIKKKTTTTNEKLLKYGHDEF